MTHDFSKCKTTPAADGNLHVLDSRVDSALVLVSAKGVKETNATVTKLCNLVEIMHSASSFRYTSRSLRAQKLVRTNVLRFNNKTT